MDQEKLRQETRTTEANRKSLLANRNLLYWYEKLYEQQFARFTGLERKNILEIGSGTSPLKLFMANVRTSDIMPLEHLDLVFDAQDIDAVAAIPDESVDIITLTNVLHHLQDPRAFLLKAAKKLRKGGVVIFTEPYMSVFSRPIYRFLHYEPTDLAVTAPVISKVEGPLSTANNALPYLIFSGPWADMLRSSYDFSAEDRSYFTWIAYMATGGIRHNFRIPGFLYRAIFYIDLALSRLFPGLFASFFTQTLTRRQDNA